jgi:hypothetical protein
MCLPPIEFLAHCYGFSFFVIRNIASNEVIPRLESYYSQEKCHGYFEHHWHG